MAHYRYNLIFLNVACFVLLRLVADFRPLVVIGFFKVVGSLALACLLVFVVVHSAKISKLFVACLKALSLCFFPLAVESWMFTAAMDSHRKFSEPSLRPLFQRPPPFLSL